MRNSNIYKKLFKQLSENFQKLKDKPEEDPVSTLDSLWLAASDTPVAAEESSSYELKELNEDELHLLRCFIKKRIQGTPLAHITGRQRFMNIDFHVSPEALVPRKETELLGKSALKLIRKAAEKNKEVQILDVCTGMGNLALSLAFYEKAAKVYASDLSAEAVNLAAANLARMGLENRVEFFCGDLLRPFDSEDFYNKIDVLTCNPPYISSKKLQEMPEEIIKHEPELAFNGGPFGIKILNRLIKESVQFIKNGGWLCFEVGEGQGPGIEKMLIRNSNFSKIITVRNEAGEIRAINAQVNKN